MAGYLDQYGLKDAKREKNVKRVAITVVVVALVAGTFWYFARTFSEERTLKRFVALLEQKDYQSAYAMWGCTDRTPCRDYKFERFMEDWGPKSPYPNPSEITVNLAEPCGNSVWITIQTPKTEELGLSVDPETKVISFTPAARCPGKWRLREFPSRLWRYMKSR